MKISVLTLLHMQYVCMVRLINDSFYKLSIVFGHRMSTYSRKSTPDLEMETAYNTETSRKTIPTLEPSAATQVRKLVHERDVKHQILDKLPGKTLLNNYVLFKVKSSQDYFFNLTSNVSKRLYGHTTFYLYIYIYIFL